MSSWTHPDPLLRFSYIFKACKLAISPRLPRSLCTLQCGRPGVALAAVLLEQVRGPFDEIPPLCRCQATHTQLPTARLVHCLIQGAVVAEVVVAIVVVECVFFISVNQSYSCYWIHVKGLIFGRPPALYEV